MLKADNTSAPLMNPGFQSFNWRHSKPKGALWA